MSAIVRYGGGALRLEDGLLEPHERELEALGAARPVRRVHAAARVVMRDAYRGVAHSARRPGSAEAVVQHIDWEATLAQRVRLDRLGFGVAEAMDTAQRFEIGWPGAARLIEQLGRARLDHTFVAGAAADQRDRIDSKHTLADAVIEQVELIASHGGEAVLLPMRFLADTNATADDYVATYRRIVEGTEGPLWVHWLGEMFVPELAGYFPEDSFERVMAIDRGRIRGVKVSLLDAGRERAIRSHLAPHGQVVLTGDDFHFADLIAGDADGFSHALLGVFDAIARPASVALRWLAHGRRDAFLALMRPCEALGQHVFQAPTMRYKAGLAFLAWLNGQQRNRMLPNHLELERDPAHYVECARLASLAGVLEDADGAAERLRRFLAEGAAGFTDA